MLQLTWNVNLQKFFFFLPNEEMWCIYYVLLNQLFILIVMQDISVKIELSYRSVVGYYFNQAKMCYICLFCKLLLQLCNGVLLLFLLCLFHLACGRHLISRQKKGQAGLACQKDKQEKSRLDEKKKRKESRMRRREEGRCPGSEARQLQAGHEKQ